MKAFTISHSNDTPKIIFDPHNHVFEISGRSLMMNVDAFYQPVYRWLEEYSMAYPQATIEMVFDIEAFNIASGKRFLFIIYKLMEMKEKGAKVSVRWYYHSNDIDVKELGEDLSKVTGHVFDIISYEKAFSTVA